MVDDSMMMIFDNLKWLALMEYEHEMLFHFVIPIHTDLDASLPLYGMPCVTSENFRCIDYLSRQETGW
jgi:hypothetical protein